ncbi:hypothetical protein [Longispora albida]|uniref:hypothetical protein n=1 Tax=Longispora albida TaxID=203523 RepID=UPI00037D2685|nr:hypothetical protein [Longispora albida]
MSIEQDITRTLTAHEGGEIDTTGLLAGATRLGRARRLRRNTAVALGAVAVLGIGLAVPALLPESGTPPASVAPAGKVFPNLPQVRDKVPASQDPKVVGSDPQLVHLTLDPALQTPGMTAGFTSQLGEERLGLVERRSDAKPGLTGTIVSAGRQAFVIPAADFERDTTVGGKPAKLFVGRAVPDRPKYAVSWVADPGIPVTVYEGFSEEAVMRVANGLRFDTVVGCKSRITATALPKGPSQYSCQGMVDDTGAITSTTLGFSPDMRIEEMPKYTRPAPGAPNTTVGGRTAYWTDRSSPGRPQWELMVDDWNGRQVVISVGSSFTLDDARMIAEGLRWG